MAEANSEATSTQRSFDVAPRRWPVAGDDIDHDTSTATTTFPAMFGTLARAVFMAVRSASLTTSGTSSLRADHVVNSWYGNTRLLAMACGSVSVSAIRSAIPATLNTPWRAKVFRFIRSICQLPCEAICCQCSSVSGNAINSWNGTSGKGWRLSAWNANSCCTNSGRLSLSNSLSSVHLNNASWRASSGLGWVIFSTSFRVGVLPMLALT